MHRFLWAGLALALVFPSGASARRGPCRTHACQMRVESRACSNARPRRCVLYVVHRKRMAGAARAWMLRVSSCESGFNPYAWLGHPKNASPSAFAEAHDVSLGLYEFKPSTFGSTPYAARWIWSARWQSFAAAWMLKQGRAHEWACR